MGTLKYDWREIARDLVLTFIVACLASIGSVHKGVLEFGVSDWKSIADAGIAAGIVVLVMVLTPLTTKYGVGSTTEVSPWVAAGAVGSSSAPKMVVPDVVTVFPDVPQVVDPAAGPGVQAGVGGSVF